MLEILCIQQLPENKVTDDTFFQQDGVTTYTTRVGRNVVNPLSPSDVISQSGDIAWTSRSLELTLCNFFVGHLKNKVHHDNLP